MRRCSVGLARSAAPAELGTAGYPRAVRRRLTIVNVMAFLIAVFSVIYAGVFFYRADHHGRPRGSPAAPLGARRRRQHHRLTPRRPVRDRDRRADRGLGLPPARGRERQGSARPGRVGRAAGRVPRCLPGRNPALRRALARRRRRRRRRPARPRIPRRGGRLAVFHLKRAALHSILTGLVGNSERQTRRRRLE